MRGDSDRVGFMWKVEWGWGSNEVGSIWKWRRGDSKDFTVASVCYEPRKPNHKTADEEKLGLRLRLQTGDYKC
ncbi:hypothetical protein MRB53_000743 [Persea americana]|uniref:Uncharacterized protein n=1 Tax=Persea americana TaxID=3435 RepID=A0ACC2MQN5_PERAE|nr:hypothetical protein MRB53_000743 [Persea americana]